MQALATLQTGRQQCYFAAEIGREPTQASSERTENSQQPAKYKIQLHRYLVI